MDCEQSYIRLLLRVGIKVVDEWQISLGYVRGSNYLRTWIFGFTCLVFKTTCIDRKIPLHEGAFSFMRRTPFPSLDKRNTRDKGMPSPTLAIDKFVEHRAIEEIRSDLVQ